MAALESLHRLIKKGSAYISALHSFLMICASPGGYVVFFKRLRTGAGFSR